MEHEPGRKRLAELTGVPAGKAETDVRGVERGETRRDGEHAFVETVRRGAQPVAETDPFRIQQHRVFNRHRKHPSLFETDDEHHRASRQAHLGQRGEKQMAGAWAIGADAQAFDALAHEAERRAQSASKGVEREQLDERILQSNERGGVNRARTRRAVLEEPGCGNDQFTEDDLTVFRRLRDGHEHPFHPVEQTPGAHRGSAIERSPLLGAIEVRRVLFELSDEVSNGPRVGPSAPRGFGTEEESGRLAG